MKSSSPRMAPTERAAAQRRNVFSIHGTHWIPSEQIECRRVRTASGSDRIIKPSSKSPEHKSHRDLIKGDCRDPVATARGSDTQDRSRTALADYDLLFAIIESNALAGLQSRNRHADRRRV